MITEERKDELQTEIMMLLEKECNIEEIKEMLREMLGYINESSSSIVKWFLKGAPK